MILTNNQSQGLKPVIFAVGAVCQRLDFYSRPPFITLSRRQHNIGRKTLHLKGGVEIYTSKLSASGRSTDMGVLYLSFFFHVGTL